MSNISGQGLEEVLEIDIVSDVVCPWCLVGFKQLEQALAETGISATVTWHPFELNPDMPAEGENLRAHLMRKYGSTAEQSQSVRDRLTELGAGLGFEFRFTGDMRMVNTFKAHRLLHWAVADGKQHALKMALFAAYFQDHKDLYNDAVLGDIAGSVGLDPAEARTVLKENRFEAEVRQAETFWAQNGIQGVPAVIFEKRHLVSGAQGTGNYEAILRQIVSGAAA